MLQHNRQLRSRVEELEETVRQLEERLSERFYKPLPADIAKLTVLEEKVLRALLARHGVVTKETIVNDIYRNEDEVDPEIVRVVVCTLRRKLKGSKIKIATAWGRGYFIERATHHAARLTADATSIAEALAA